MIINTEKGISRLLNQAHKFLCAAIKLFKEQTYPLLKQLKGSKKDPLLYLGSFSIILLILVVFTPKLLTEDSFVFSAENSLCDFENQSQDNKEGFFVGQSGKKTLESPDFSLVQDNTLTGFSMPIVVSPQILGSLTENSTCPERGNEIIEYSVQAGDTIAHIAEQFDISINTLLWANNLSKNSSLKPGQKLVILPISGVLHHVKSGETISQIAKKYKADANEIIIFNELSNEGDINIGDILIIPNGTMPVTAPSLAPALAPLASSYFICPISQPCRVTQGLHWYNAIDFSHGKCGESIFAAAGGQVLKVKYGWNGGAGNYVTILHPNGVVTMYGHLQTILVSQGQQVSQGQIIATMGGQPGTAGAGRSSGCHLHFGVTGARNPFSR